MFLGGDFNCTENPTTLDRNHPEPHPPSSHILRQLMENQELSDVWRVFNSTDSAPGASVGRRGLSLARLDCFYCFKHHLNIFKRCCVQPVGFSVHFLVSCHVFIKNIHLKSAYWHFNMALLDDQAFRTAGNPTGRAGLPSLTYNSGGTLVRHR